MTASTQTEGPLRTITGGASGPDDGVADDAPRYAAFISYRHVEPDRAWAKWLHAALETYRVPERLRRERPGLPVRLGRLFRDEDELPASAELKSEIDAALRQSRFLIVVCSPRTPASLWVNREVERFRELGRHDRILALLVEGEPGESFPKALREIRRAAVDGGADEVEEVEPLAADVRPARRERPGHLRRLAKLRLAACLLGVTFDDLRQRELQRRRRNRLAAGAALAVLLCVLGGLTAGFVRSSEAAARAARLDALERQFDAAVDRNDWDEPDVRRAEALADEMAALDFARAVEAKHRVRGALAESVRAMLRRPKLDAAALTVARGRIDLLAPRDPAAAADLRRAADERARAWETAFELRAPFDDLGSVLADPSHVRKAGEALQVNNKASSVTRQAVATRAPSRGDARLDARFDQPTHRDVDVALWLDADPSARDPSRGYVCRLVHDTSAEARRATAEWSPEPTAPDAAAPAPAPVAAPGVQPADLTALAPYRLELLRHGRRLHVRYFSTEEVGTGELRLSLRRQGSELVTQLNGWPPVTYRDVFWGGAAGGGAGVFAVRMSGGAPLVGLTGMRLNLPVTPSPFERGDDLYAAGRFVEALDAYREAAGDVASGHGAEARYKQAACLAALDRHAEAVVVWEQLANEPGDPWPMLAVLQLWVAAVREDRADDAAAALDLLSARESLARLDPLVPADIRALLLAWYSSPPTMLASLNFDPARERRMAHGVRVFDALGPSRHESWNARARLLVAQLRAGADAAALASFGEHMAGDRLEREASPGVVVEMFDFYTWLKWNSRDPERLFGRVTQAMYRDGRILPERAALLIFRARAAAAEGRWPEAERDLDEFFRMAEQAEANWSPGKSRGYNYTHYGAACLFRGFVRDRRGDAEGARAAWRLGVRRLDPADPDSAARFTRDINTGRAALYAVLNGALSGDLRPADTQVFVDRLVRADAGDGAATLLLKAAGDSIAPALLEAWRTPRGREQARRIAFCEVTYSQLYAVTVEHGGLALILRGLAPGVLGPDGEEVALAMLRDLYRAFTSGKLSRGQIAQLAVTWKGTTGFLGWGGVKGGLDPSIRGPLAYTFGLRLEHLKRPAEAADFFRTALADAPPGSPLEKFARAKLDAMPPATQAAP